MSARHKWTRLVLFGTLPWLKKQRKIDVLRKDLFHCERLQSRGVNPKIPQARLVFIFTFFDGNNKAIPGTGWALRARTNSKKADLTKNVSSSTDGTRLVPRGAVESLTVSDWLVSGSNPSVFFCAIVFSIFFSSSFFLSVSRVLFYWSDSSWQERGITFDWTFGENFTTMVAVWAGEFQYSKVRVRKRVWGDRRARKLRKWPVLNFCSWNFRRKAVLLETATENEEGQTQI